MERLAKHQLTQEERQEFDSMLYNPANEELFVAAAAAMEIAPEDIAPYDARLEEVLQATLAYDRPASTRHRIRPMFRWAAAAAVAIVIISAGGYLLRHQQQKQHIAAVPQQTIPPGKDGAVLTLDDGSQVVLDSIGNGWLISKSGEKVQMSNGTLQYKNDSSPGKIAYNTMQTPRGRQFAVVLPDGTKVWLNSASSLRYPTCFHSSRREVQLSGEAYFEVAHNARQPFIVNISDQSKVEVLGTDFNIKAYSNEKNIEATLLSGAVRVAKGNEHTILKPGQQASIRQSGITVNEHADIERITAWKNGLFYFDGVQLEDAMRQLERWYDIEVQYENGVPDIRFGGKMNRNITLNELLRILARADLKCRLEGNKLIIMR
ncbi:FecR family protein [Chitinophaga eiseniae]|uniref:DUF4974 domain-containing protein n=1 Tax=Chitinophaga eiseniae TaxID=634771 RepID=A0A847SIX1_9BACT|nr:FecR family protein [Chitinophaga eiseniae]NLR77306.1 DUF4974 domain-containing protein [Chitinophaga eiseniae]